MGDSIIKIIVTLALAAIIIALLPNSPVQNYIAQLADNDTFNSVIGYVNWVIPFGKMLDVTAIWFAAIGAYYAIRWIGAQLDIFQK